MMKVRKCLNESVPTHSRESVSAAGNSSAAAVAIGQRRPSGATSVAVNAAFKSRSHDACREPELTICRRMSSNTSHARR